MFERMGSQFEGIEQLETDEENGISLDVSESDDEVTVTADLPGYAKDDIDVSVRENHLTLRAERDRETEAEDEQYHRRERVHREVTRTVRLPAEIDEDGASAAYQNGVLTVTFPKTAPDEDSHSIDID